MKSLDLNESVTCVIHADQVWNSTGIELTEGCSYALETIGDAVWKDWFIRTGPEGFTKWYLRWSAGKKRMKNENWFALIGTYGKEMPFLIGKGMPELRPPVTGELVCYANDILGFYGNNSGALTLKVRRLT